MSFIWCDERTEARGGLYDVVLRFIHKAVHRARLALVLESLWRFTANEKWQFICRTDV